MTTNDVHVYYVEYRSVHFGLLEPNKDILQVIKLTAEEAEQKKHLSDEWQAKQKEVEGRQIEFNALDRSADPHLRENLRSKYSDEWTKEVGPTKAAYDCIDGERMVFIAPMGKYAVPLILNQLPDDFRTEKEFWEEKRYWDK
jgi:hypothetical protein